MWRVSPFVHLSPYHGEDTNPLHLFVPALKKSEVSSIGAWRRGIGRNEYG
jgi:hypothetical protein